MNKLLPLLSLLVSFSAHAVEGRDGNGGTELAFEFKQLGGKAVAAVLASPAIYPEAQGHDLALILANASVVLSLEPLFVVKGPVVQECTAKNYRNPDTILVHQKSWERITSDPVKQALALHEVLGLAGVEGTGEYPVSNRYLQNLGVDCRSGLCDQGEEATYGPMKFHAMCHGPTKGKCVNPPDSAKSGDKYPVIGGGSCATPAHDFLDVFEFNEDLNEKSFTCDDRGVKDCVKLNLENQLQTCREKAKKRGWSKADLAACVKFARETVERQAPDTGIATDGRCYVRVP